MDFALSKADTKLLAWLCTEQLLSHSTKFCFACLGCKCVHYDIRGLSNIWVTRVVFVLIVVSFAVVYNRFFLLFSLLENVSAKFAFSNGILRVTFKPS